MKIIDKCILAAVCVTLSYTAASADDRYSVSLMGMYGWNSSFQSYGGIDISGHMPINTHFEADAALEYHSGASVFAFTAVARPKFPLPTGELFLEGSLHTRVMSRYDITHFAAGASFGYRMDYVSAQIGLSTNMLLDMQRKDGDQSTNLCEPFNLLYRLAFKVRPHTSCWNISLGVGNFTEYEYERTFQPIFFLGGHYDINDHFRVQLLGELKPSGIMNMTQQFWGIRVRGGAAYVF